MLITAVSMTSFSSYATGDSTSTANAISSVTYNFVKHEGDSAPCCWFTFTPTKDALYEIVTKNITNKYTMGGNVSVYESEADALADKNKLQFVNYNTYKITDSGNDYCYVDTYNLKKDVTYYIHDVVYTKSGVDEIKMDVTISQHYHVYREVFTLPSGGDCGEYGKECAICGKEEIDGFENPSVPTGLTLVAGKKKFTAKWKKPYDAKGYQIKYSTSKKFTKKTTKTVNIKDVKTLKKTIKNVKSKTTYYVKMRTYKKVGSHKVYSSWCAAKKVKVK